MKLSDCIDFSFFHQDYFEGVSDNETEYILCRNTNIPYYIDDQIENNNKEKLKCIKKAGNFLKFLDNAKRSGNEYVKLKNKYLTDNEYFKTNHAVFYKSDKYFLFFFRLCYESDSLEMSIASLIDYTTNEYIFIGTDSEHYFIHTNTFTYVDSSGIANSDYFLIDPQNDNDSGNSNSNSNSDSDEKNTSKSNNNANCLTSRSKPMIVINAMENILEYLIESMDQ